MPVLIIGQARTGKTSLKKSLKGELFNPNEGSTEGIETDPSYFKVTTDVWRTGKSSDDTEPEPTFSFEHQTAQFILESITKELSRNQASNSWTEPFNELSNADSEDLSNKGINPSPPDSQDHLSGPKLPEDVAALVQRLLEQNNEDEDDIYSIVWDFGGQSVYYETHPIFLTGKAIYILTCDLSRDPFEKANPPTKKGMYENIIDTWCDKRNVDYLDFWMSSVYSLVNHHTENQETLLSEKLPPVFLVCTHADKPYRSGNPEDLALKIYSSLKREIYGRLLKGLFVIDNTKAGSEEECRDVIKLREKVLSVAKNLPQMNEPIPLKWLKYEKVLRLLGRKGYKRVPIDKARKIAVEECGIDDDVQFRTLLDFLHDQRMLIYFSQSPQLDNKDMVILSPQWLIDVFKEVITVKSYRHVEGNVEKLWSEFQETGILEEKLLDHAWRPLLDDQETSKSQIGRAHV